MMIMIIELGVAIRILRMAMPTTMTTRILQVWGSLDPVADTGRPASITIVGLLMIAITIIIYITRTIDKRPIGGMMIHILAAIEAMIATR